MNRRKIYITALRKTWYISLITVGVGGLCFGIIDYLELLAIYGKENLRMFTFPDWIIVICIFSYLALGIPSIISGSLVSYKIIKDHHANNEITKHNSMKRGILYGLISVQVLVIPYLLFDYSLFSYQRHHLIDFSVYINPYIRGIEGVIIAAITGGVSGLVINNQTIKHFRETGFNHQN